MDIRCRKCGRFLGSVDQNMRMKLKCANCKQYSEYRVTYLSTVHADAHIVETNTRKKPTKDSECRTQLEDS